MSSADTRSESVERGFVRSYFRAFVERLGFPSRRGRTRNRLRKAFARHERVRSGTEEPLGRRVDFQSAHQETD